MTLTVLINAGPWLPVPPPDYGGIENVLATLIPELRARGVEVVLCTVEESAVEVDDRRFAFPDGQFGRLAGPYAQVMGITHAHMATVLETLGERPDIDLVHDHLEVVGPSVLGAIDGGPPVLQTLHWDLRKHPEFYGSFDGKGRVLFNGVSDAQLRTAPANLRRQSLGAVHLGVDLATHRFQADKGEDYLVLGRVTPFKGQDVAARICKELGMPLVMAGPVAGVALPAGAVLRPWRTRPARCTATATSATTWTPCSRSRTGSGSAGWARSAGPPRRSWSAGPGRC